MKTAALRFKSSDLVLPNKLGFVGLAFSKGSGGTISPVSNLEIFEVYFDFTNIHFYKIAYPFGGDALSSPGPELFRIDSNGPIVQATAGNLSSGTVEQDFKFNFSGTNFGFALFTKEELRPLIQYSDFLYLSDAVMDFGVPVHSITEPSLTANKKDYFTLKLEGDMAGMPAFGATSIFDKTGVPTAVLGQPCPPHWRIPISGLFMQTLIPFVFRRGFGDNLEEEDYVARMQIAWTEFAFEFTQELGFKYPVGRPVGKDQGIKDKKVGKMEEMDVESYPNGKSQTPAQKKPK